MLLYIIIYVEDKSQLNLIEKTKQYDKYGSIRIKTKALHSLPIDKTFVDKNICYLPIDCSDHLPLILTLDFLK